LRACSVCGGPGVFVCGRHRFDGRPRPIRRMPPHPCALAESTSPKAILLMRLGARGGSPPLERPALRTRGPMLVLATTGGLSVGDLSLWCVDMTRRSARSTRWSVALEHDPWRSTRSPECNEAAPSTEPPQGMSVRTSPCVISTSIERREPRAGRSSGGDPPRAPSRIESTTLREVNSARAQGWGGIRRTGRGARSKRRSSQTITRSPNRGRGARSKRRSSQTI
jgi:hypothetical protein